MFRAIQDDVPISTSLNSLSDRSFRVYINMLASTDAWGRLPGERTKIRNLCVPMLAISDSELAAALDELVRAGRIALYRVDEVVACQLLDFDRHQPVARIKRAASRWPAPPQTAAPAQTDTAPAENGREKSLQNRRSTDRETETVEERVLGSSNVPLDVELPNSESKSQGEVEPDERLRFHKFDLVKISETLRGADERTPWALASVLAKPRPMPEAALASAIEQLERRRRKPPRLDSEVRYLVGTLSTMRREGQYA